MADEINDDRLSTWDRYDKVFRDISGTGRIEVPTIPTDCVHNAHMYYLKLRDIEDRTEFINRMKEKDVLCVFHYVPLHSAPAGIKFGRFSGQDTFTTNESDRLVRLPLYYNMDETDIIHVIESVKSVLN